ncbi:hypothetical protein BROC_01930 [Candidatus Brocadiaceae bacterium]|nr:hypothetical protein BROC_01930 [Candidatus Brocadiaceae bacterium]
MFKQVKTGFVFGVLIIGIFATGIILPAVAAAKDKIIGTVSSLDESTGTLTIIDNLVEINVNNAKIEKRGLDNATLSDIQEGDIIKITGAADEAGLIEASSIKDPVKLNKKYDGKITGKTSKVNTSADTFYIMGQKVDAGNLAGVTMGGRTISFDNMRSGVRVDVYVIDKNSQLVAKKMAIRSESCNFCH